jgi:RHS repeat-associated protein
MVTLADPDDPLSLQTLVDTVTVNGETFTRTYDAATRRLTLTTPEGRQRFVSLDARGRPTSASTPGLAAIDFAYDPLGRLAEIGQGTGADRRTVSFSYDPASWLAAITDPLSRTVGFARDPAGRVTSQTLADGSQIGFTYDANGNLATLTPPGRPAHAFAYTPLDFVALYDPPDVGVSPDTTASFFDLDRRLDAVIRPDGGTIDPGYGPATGRLTSIALPGGDALTYSYHPTSGSVSGISGPAGVALSYSYDGLLLTDSAWSGEVTGTVGRTYDANLRVTERTVNGGSAVSFVYDQDGLLTGAGELTITRDPSNGLVIGTTLGQVTTSRVYNEFGEMVQDSAAFAGGEIYRVAYSRDRLGRITEKAETIGGATATWGYGYDLAGRLASVTLDGSPYSSYTYDTNGNRLTYAGPFGSAAGTYDDQDRLLQYGDTTYTYTAAGELASKTQGAQTATFDYDALGNLRHVALPSGPTIEYVVDGRSRRVGKKVLGALVQGFLYQDQLNPIGELDSAGAVVARFVYGTRANVPDYMVKGGLTYRIFSDHLGSPRLVVDIASGEVAQRLDYDEFGRVTLDSAPGFQPFGFAGGLYDPQSGLVRFGARDYDAETGTWTAKDRLGFAGADTNIYTYSFSDPVNFIDVDGESALAIGVGIAGLAVIVATTALVTSPGYQEWARDRARDFQEWKDNLPTDEPVEPNYYDEFLNPPAYDPGWVCEYRGPRDYPAAPGKRGPRPGEYERRRPRDEPRREVPPEQDPPPPKPGWKELAWRLVGEIFGAANKSN